MKIGISIDPLGKIERHEFDDADTDDNTRRIHEMIGGYLQLVPNVPGVSMFCNEDGMRLNLPVNYCASMIAQQSILGTVVLMGTVNRKGDCNGLSDEQINAAEILAADWRSTISVYN